MDAKEALLEYFDKIALGAAGLILIVLVVLPLVGESPAKALRTKVDRYNKTISALRRAVKDNPPKAPELAVAREVRRVLAGGPTPETWPAWLMHKRVLILCRRIGLVVPDPPEHYAPIDVSGAGGLGAITIQWVENPRNRLVKILGYRIERNDLDLKRDDAWKVVATVSASAHRYRDASDLEPGKSYWYRIVSRATEDQGLSVVRKYDLALPKEQRERRSVVVGPFSTQPEIYLELQSVRVKEIQNGRLTEPLAYMKIYRFFRDEGRWEVSPLLTVKPGERIGRALRRRGKTLDFTTDYELVRTRRTKRERVLPGGAKLMESVDIAVLRNTQTGEELELNNRDRAEVLKRIKADPTYGTQESEDREGAGDAKQD